MRKERTCCWCGDPINRSKQPYSNRRGEYFCRLSHRAKRNKGVREFLARLNAVTT